MLQSRPQSSPPTIRLTHDAVTNGYAQEKPSAPFNLSAIGSILKERREGKGISIVGASEELFIKKSTLTAIESGQWVSLPHPVYVKGYLRSYASYLGVLDAVETRLSSRREGEETPTVGQKIHGPIPGGIGSEEPRSGLRRFFLPRIALVASSIAAVLTALALSSGIQTTTLVGLKDVLAGLHLAIADVRRIIFP